MGYTAKEFEKYILDARNKFISLSAHQEKELGRMYIRFAERVKLEAEIIVNKESLTYASKQKLIKSLLKQAADLTDDFKGLLDKALLESANLGKEANEVILAKYSQKLNSAGFDVNMGRILQSVPDDVVKLAYSRIWEDGLRLSDRIWQLNRRTQNELQRIIMEEIAAGRSASSKVLEARLDNLLNPDRRFIQTSLHGRNVSFDAARLLRTERTVAFREADRLAAMKNPGLKGIKWGLGSAEEHCTTCISLATSDSYGLGAGVFLPEDLPVTPHPQCTCYTYPVTISSDEFVNNWSEWVNSKSSHPEITDWFNNVYRKAA